MSTKSLELKHTIKLIRELDTKIQEIESHINTIDSQYLRYSLFKANKQVAISLASVIF